VLSARSGSPDKVQALDLGADDYVTKPFNMDELLARLRATSRRGAAADEAVVARVGDTTIDLAATTAVGVDGEAIHLTPTEWKILDVLLRRPGKLVAGGTLLTAVRGSSDHTDPSYLRIYLAQLRRKLEPEPSRPRHLITEPGMGYRYRP
jgi:two-component system KDP operon response regulator KdpE